MIRLVFVVRSSDVAEELNLVRGNVVRFNKCDKLDECFHIK